MVLREARARILMSEIGCNNKKFQKGFTLIEILAVLIIIGISTTLITLNFSTLKPIDSQDNSFEKTVNFLTEESIVTGNIIGWYLNSNKQFAEYINDNKNIEIIDVPMRGCQLAIRVKNYDKKLFNNLTENGIVADWREPDVIRIAPVPLYNTFTDAFNFYQTLKKLL